MAVLLLSCGLLAGLHAASAAAVCRPKSWTHRIKAYRKEAGCPNAAPKDCVCVANDQPSDPCPLPNVTLWNSTGKECVRAHPDKDKAWKQHGWYYPADYGSTCIPNASSTGAPEGDHWIEPGSYHCTKVRGRKHKFQWGSPGYRSTYDSEDWCKRPGCFVDPCTCNHKDITVSKWFSPSADGKNLYWSYAQCGSKDSFTPAFCSGHNSSSACAGETDCIWEKEEEEELKLPNLWAVLLGVVLLLKCCRDECRRAGGCSKICRRYCCCFCSCFKCYPGRRCRRCCRCCLCCKLKPEVQPSLDPLLTSTMSLADGRDGYESLEVRFESACAEAWALTAAPDANDLLEMYGLYKQATEGDIPASLEQVRLRVVGGLREASKREAWVSRRGMSRRQAMRKYIAIVEKLKRECDTE